MSGQTGRVGSGPRFAFFYGALFFAAGVQLPFWPLWLSGRGLSAEEVGFLLAAGTWARVAVAPLFGEVADRSQHLRSLLLFCSFTSIAAFLMMPLSQGFWSLLAFQIAAYALSQPLLPLGESQAMRRIQSRRPALSAGATALRAAMDAAPSHIVVTPGCPVAGIADQVR
ncbi:MAG: MFS transporter [Limibacillus sp.]